MRWSVGIEAEGDRVLSREEVVELNLDTGVPLVYVIGDDGAVKSKEVRK